MKRVVVVGEEQQALEMALILHSAGYHVRVYIPNYARFEATGALEKQEIISINSLETAEYYVFTDNISDNIIYYAQVLQRVFVPGSTILLHETGLNISENLDQLAHNVSDFTGYTLGKDFYAAALEHELQPDELLHKEVSLVTHDHISFYYAQSFYKKYNQNITHSSQSLTKNNAPEDLKEISR